MTKKFIISFIDDVKREKQKVRNFLFSSRPATPTRQRGEGVKKGIILFITLSFLMPVFVLAQDNSIVDYYEKAVILEFKEITREMTEGDEGFTAGDTGIISIQKIDLKILSGKFKGQEKLLENSVLANPADLKIYQGDKVIVYLQEFVDGSFEVQIHDYYRLPQLMWLTGIFLFLVILVGRKKGLRAAISLLISILLIFKIFIPLVLKGVSPVWLTLAIASIITIITLLIIAGFKKKTLAAILGTIGGLVCATIVVIIFGNLSRLTGLSSEEARILLVNYPMDFKGLLFSGIIIAALGAVMDVAMSISSAMAEIRKNQPDISQKQLIKSGMSIGQDIIGTMSNTLIFAYVGASFFTLLLFTQFGESYLKFFNFDFVAEEIIGAIAGSIGLILAVPITAIIAGFLEYRNK